MITELKKQNILDDLKNIEKCVSIIYRMIDKSKYLDDGTKQNILELTKTTQRICNQEMDKEIKRQKEDGKIFLSDDDIDYIFSSIINK